MERKLMSGFLFMLFVHVLVPVHAIGNVTQNNNAGEFHVEINTRWELMDRRKHCKWEKDHLKETFSQEGTQGNWQYNYSDECKYIDNFSMSKLTSDEIFRWVEWSNGESRAVRMLINGRTGVSTAALKNLILNLINTGYSLSSGQLAALSRIGEAYFKRQGIIASLTVDDIREFGPGFVNLLPPRYFRKMSDELFDYVLQLHDAENDKQRLYQDRRDAAMSQGQEFNETKNFTDGVTYSHLVWVDQPRLRALCRRAFSQYKHFNNLTTTNLDKVRYLMQCAPPKECSNLPNNWVQNNVDVLADLPFNCHHKRDTDEWFKKSSALYSTGNICGRYVAQKTLEGGDNPLVLSSQEDIVRMKGLILCIPDSYARTAIDLAGCEMAKDAALKGYLKPSFVKYTFGNCIQLPENTSTLNCSYIASTYGPYLSEMKRSFYQSIPKSMRCEDECLSAFESGNDMPRFVKKYITRTCFAESNTVLNSDAVNSLGSMVTDLPPEKFGEIGAADLERNMDAIKKEMRGSSVKRNHLRHAVIKQLGEKMLDSGKISSITDSKEIMKEISINELKSKVTNIEADLGLDSHDVDLSDSQNKWVMEQIKKDKRPSNFSAADIRAKKSVVKGFLRSDIEEIAEYQNQRNDPKHMEIAKALCEQSNWPFGPLRTINRKLIKTALTTVNSSVPFSFLSEVDAESLDCQCMMDFRGTELTQMLPGVCASVCTKIGYCNRLRCMHPDHRRELLSACMTCMDIKGKQMTFSDIDTLGPNLISQFTQGELQQYVPGEAVKMKLHELQHMCMDKDFRNSVSGALITHIGSDGSVIDETTLRLLGSAIMLFPQSIQQQMNKTINNGFGCVEIRTEKYESASKLILTVPGKEAVIAAMAKDIMKVVNPSDESNMELQQCCEKWFTQEDKAALLLQKKTLMITVKDAVIWKLQNARKKRSTVVWTCDDIQLVGEAFTTATDAEINNIAADEFAECLSDIGQLVEWTEVQKSLLLQKTLSSLNTTVCNMTGDEAVQLGVIAQAITGSDLGCLPLDEGDVMSSFGSLTGWNATQLASLAEGYMTANSINDLSNISVSDVAVLGQVVCGFEPSKISTIAVDVVAASGTQLGRLEDCSQDQYSALKDLALDPAAYGGIANWTAADVTELSFLLVGLSSEDIKMLNTDALEGLKADVIEQLQPAVFAAMTDTQLQALTSDQVALVTDQQKNLLSAAQKGILSDITQGFFDSDGDNNGGDNNEPSAAESVKMATVWLLFTSILMLIAV